MYCDLGMYLVYAQSTGSTVHGSLVNLERERERRGAECPCYCDPNHEIKMCVCVCVRARMWVYMHACVCACMHAYVICLIQLTIQTFPSWLVGFIKWGLIPSQGIYRLVF